MRHRSHAAGISFKLKDFVRSVVGVGCYLQYGLVWVEVWVCGSGIYIPPHSGVVSRSQTKSYGPVHAGLVQSPENPRIPGRDSKPRNLIHRGGVARRTCEGTRVSSRAPGVLYPVGTRFIFCRNRTRNLSWSPGKEHGLACCYGPPVFHQRVHY